jgi:hypothetical protein
VGLRTASLATTLTLTEERILAQVQESTVGRLCRRIQDRQAFGLVQVIILKVSTISLIHSHHTADQVLKRLVLFEQLLQVIVLKQSLSAIQAPGEDEWIQ